MNFYEVSSSIFLLAFHCKKRKKLIVKGKVQQGVTEMNEEPGNNVAAVDDITDVHSPLDEYSNLHNEVSFLLLSLKLSGYIYVQIFILFFYFIIYERFILLYILCSLCRIKFNFCKKYHC